MRKRFWFSIFMGVLTGAAIAQDDVLKSLNSGVEASPWEAVGRIDLGGRGFCTGALIEPDIVLTAAHCLFDKETETRIDHAQIEFLAGWRNGRASAYRDVRRVVIHPDYDFGGANSPKRVRNDIALLQLQHPIRNTTITPFQTARRPDAGASVGVVSYAQDRSEAPSLQEVCEVLSYEAGVLVSTCSVDFGASGAPIFAFGSGEAKIVSVVSAKAEVEGRKISLGTDLDTPLQFLRAELDQANTFFKSAQPPATDRLNVTTSQSTGAKFVRPER